MTASNCFRASLIGQILLAAFLPLADGIPPLLFLLAWRKRNRVLLMLCVSHYLAWLALQVKNYRSPAPDATHLALLAALVLILIFALAGLWKLERESPAPFPLWVFR
jgi:hypothetical protein